MTLELKGIIPQWLPPLTADGGWYEKRFGKTD